MPSLSPVEGAVLRAGRTHEAHGPAARSFAAALCGAANGPVLWIAGPSGAVLCPQGLAGFFDPGRLIVVSCAWPRDILWSAEEALRSGAAPVVVAETGRAPDLTESRRLQLAAETGGGLGLMITDVAGASNAAETRWHCAPLPGAGANDSTIQRWKLIKNKKGTLGMWTVDLSRSRYGTAYPIGVVSPAGERAASAGAMGR